MHFLIVFYHDHLLSSCVPGTICAQSLQLCPTRCGPMDHSLPGPSVHGILQAGLLEWVAISFSRGSLLPRDGTSVSCIAGGFFTTEPLGKPTILLIAILSLATPRGFPEKGSNSSPQWKRGGLITASPGNSLASLMKKTGVNYEKGCELSLFSVLLYIK